MSETSNTTPIGTVSEGAAAAIAAGTTVPVETADDVLAVLNQPKPARVRKPKLTIVSARKIAAYRAHRTMIERRMKGSTKSVRAELAAKLAEYDRLLATLKAAA